VEDADATCLACPTFLKVPLYLGNQEVMKHLTLTHRQNFLSIGVAPEDSHNPRRRGNTTDTLSECYGISLGTGRGARRRALGKNIRGRGRKSDFFFPVWRAVTRRDDGGPHATYGMMYKKYDAGGERSLLLRTATLPRKINKL
jgi:hypothetical protein